MLLWDQASATMHDDLAGVPARRMIAAAAFAAALSGALATIGDAAPADSCAAGNAPCKLGDRSYHLRVPDGWDGETPLPVLLHFHGWGRQGDVSVRHRHVGAAADMAGVLLIAPNGRSPVDNAT